MLGVARREAEALDPHFGPPSSLCGLGAPPSVRLGLAWAEHVGQWAEPRARFIPAREKRSQEPAGPSTSARLFSRVLRSMQLSGALAALCGVLLCAPGLFAASGESPAPPFGPRPSSARRSEVLSGALPPPLLLTNLSKA